MLAPRDVQMDRERLHFTILQNLTPNNDFNAIKYLYDRLNIIDAKAQGLLTRNGLLLTVISIIGSVKLRDDPKLPCTLLCGALDQWSFAAGFVLLIGSTLMTFPLVLLTFDHVTVVPKEARPELEKRARLATAESLQAAVAGDRTMADYLETFFAITLYRQALLRAAQIATIVASILFFSLIGLIFWQKLDHLHLR